MPKILATQFVGPQLVEFVGLVDALKAHKARQPYSSIKAETASVLVAAYRGVTAPRPSPEEATISAFASLEAIERLSLPDGSSRSEQVALEELFEAATIRAADALVEEAFPTIVQPPAPPGESAWTPPVPVTEPERVEPALSVIDEGPEGLTF